MRKAPVHRRAGAFDREDVRKSGEASAQSGIESVTQPVAENAGGERYAEDDGSGRDGYPPCVDEIVAAFAEHGAQTGERGLYAQTEKAISGTDWAFDEGDSGNKKV